MAETFNEFAVRSAVEGAIKNALIADAALRFVMLEHELDGDRTPDTGTVTACMAAHHDMRVLAEIPCGCDDGTCPGVIG